MPSSSTTTLADIDWNLLWQNARKERSWSSKKAADWDQRAQSFAARNQGSPFVSLLLDRLPLSPELSVLDVGSGPGTLAIPLAARVDSVTAVDYSNGMLEMLSKKARENGITNIRTIHGAWEDDWQRLGIAPHDLVIASRSLSVDDLAPALQKLNQYARGHVFIVDRVTPTPFDPDVFAATGRDFRSGPDYIYTINILYNLGIHPCVEILELERDVVFAGIDEAMQAYGWMLKDLIPTEEAALRRYLDSRMIHATANQITIRRRHPPRWALIWWKKEDPPEVDR